MQLIMKKTCQTCDAPLAPDGEAYICSYLFTYCPSCSERRKHLCPHCAGELVRRPRRTTGLGQIAVRAPKGIAQTVKKRKARAREE